MPLPSISAGLVRRCHAKAKSTGVQCLNPAAFGTPVCRNHGARRPETVKRGADHPCYKHGQRTKAAEREASLTAARLRTLEDEAYRLGLIASNVPRTRGRKPKAV